MVILYIELYNLPLGSAEVQALLLLSVVCEQQSSSFDHSHHEFLVKYMLLLQDQRHKMTKAIFTSLPVPFMIDSSNSIREKIIVLRNLFCLSLLAIVNKLVICYSD